jgi:hypothetical protein
LRDVVEGDEKDEDGPEGDDEKGRRRGRTSGNNGDGR